MTTLPIDKLHPEFLDIAQKHTRMILTAPTGSGKSTRVPLWFAQMGLRTLVIEPRRLACRSLATYIAASKGQKPGEEIGFAVRHEKRFKSTTRVVYATPGTALRMMQEAPGKDLLPSWDALIIDEFHERHIDTDLLLALAKKNPPQYLLVMSATLEAARLGRWLEAPVLEGEGRTFPVDLEYSGCAALPDDRNLETRVNDAVKDALSLPGDMLVFLPGKGEISACAQALQKTARAHNLEVLPLHGDLKPNEQDRIFREEGPRRIILSTNVAETSVTVPRVGVVIDSGLVRQTQYHYGHGALRLVPISEDSAEQRRGRAGRVRAGHCIRLWSKTASLAPITKPQILREPLTDAALTLATCGSSLDALDLPTAPERYAVQSAMDTLKRLGCVDPSGSVTPVGAQTSRLPLEVQHARVLVAAQTMVQQGEHKDLLQDLVDLLAGQSGRSPLLQSPKPSEERESWQEPHCDATLLIQAMRHGKPARDNLHPWSLQEARRVAQQLRTMLGLPKPTPNAPIDRIRLARAWIRANPRNAFARRKRGSAFSNEGTEVRPDRRSLLKEDIDAVVVTATHSRRDKSGKMTHTATCTIPLSLDILLQEGLGTETASEPRVEKKKTLYCVVETAFAGRTLSRKEQVPTGKAAADALLACIDQKRIHSKTLEETHYRAAAWNLYKKIKKLSSPPPIDPVVWLREQAKALEFEDGHDLELILPEDLLLPWPKPMDEYEQRWFQKNYPLTITVNHVTYDVTYKLSTRTVTIEPRGKKSHKAPALGFLPPWSGWRVQHKRASNITVLRR